MNMSSKYTCLGNQLSKFAQARQPGHTKIIGEYSAINRWLKGLLLLLLKSDI